jgi:3',5'-cyclic AMP phosphodiesterase CpdA
VLGNHCVDLLTKEEFRALTTAAPLPLAVDRGDWRLLFLDACFRADGTAYQRKNFTWTDTAIPADQLRWLEARLADGPPHALVFTHQRLDGSDDSHSVANHAEIRRVLVASGRVRAVVSGHSHQNDHRVLEGLPHLVLRAMVEGPGLDNNAFGQLHLHRDGRVRVEGHGRQASLTVT